MDPPFQLSNNEVIAQVINSRGNLFDVEVPESMWTKTKQILNIEPQTLLVKLSPKLKNKIFARRNGYVLLSLEQIGKVSGEITNVVQNVRDWERSLGDEWPIEYKQVKQSTMELELPPSFSSDDEA